MVNPYPIAEWSNFLIAEASASAALTGLVFVAVSINLARVLTTPGVPARAGESIVQLLGVLIVSTFGLIPSQSKTALGVELLATGLTLSAGQIVLQVRALRAYRKTSWILSRVALGQLSALPFCVAGIFELRQLPGALYWLVPGVIASFIAGVAGAWVVLVEILR